MCVYQGMCGCASQLGVGLLGRQRAIPWSLLGGRRPTWTCDDGCAGHGLCMDVHLQVCSHMYVYPSM